MNPLLLLLNLNQEIGGGPTLWADDVAGKAYGTVHFLAMDVAALGDTSILGPISGKRIKVLRYSLSAAGAVNARWKSSGGQVISSLKTLAAAGASFVEPYCPAGVLASNLNEGLTLNLSAAVAVGLDLAYVVMP